MAQVVVVVVGEHIVSLICQRSLVSGVIRLCTLRLVALIDY